ncbi:MAG: response regulator [Oceanidesulfovibrio sp.]
MVLAVGPRSTAAMESRSDVYHGVVSVEHGREALLAAARHKPDIALVDDDVEPEGAVRLVGRLRSLDPVLPVIYLVSDLAVIAEAASQGSAAFIPPDSGPEILDKALKASGRQVLRNRELAEYRRVTETMLHGMVHPALLVHPVSRVILQANDSAAQLGLAVGNTLDGPFFLESAFPDAVASFRGFDAALARMGFKSSAEVRAYDRCWEVTANRVATWGVLVTATDITQRAQAREELERLVRVRTMELSRSRERLELLVDNLPLMVRAFDENGVHIFWNKECERVTGYTSEQIVLNPNASSLLYPAGDAAPPSPPHGCCTDREIAISAADGSLLVTAWTNIARDFPIPGWATWETGRDVTLAREMESQLRKAREAAESANEAKSSFLASMSHEIRTPLNSIIGFTSLVLNSTPTDEQRESLNYIRLSSRELLEIINDILDISRIEAGHVELEQEVFSIRSMINETMALFRPQLENRELSLNLRIDPATPSFVVGDQTRFRQVLMNLLSNAIKFSRKGEIGVLVEPAGVDEEEDGPLIHVSVSDQGTGIPHDKLSTIFDSFTRLESTARYVQGTGLGLAICKRLVSILGGAIWAESEIGSGATFHFTARFQLAGSTPCARNMSACQTDAPTRPLTLLVVDDDQSGRRMLARTLQAKGHEVMTATTGSESLEMLARFQFDCVLLDIRLPGMDGMETTRLLRSGSPPGVRPNTPVVAVTAFAIKGDRERFLAAGMDEYVAKPVDFRLLDRILARLTALDVAQPRC